MMRVLHGKKYRVKKVEMKGHRRFALSVILNGEPALFCSETKKGCRRLARRAGFIGDIDDNRIQDVVLVSADSLSEI